MSRNTCSCNTCTTVLRPFFDAMSLCNDSTNDNIPQWAEDIVAQYGNIDLPECDYIRGDRELDLFQEWASQEVEGLWKDAYMVKVVHTCGHDLYFKRPVPTCAEEAEAEAAYLAQEADMPCPQCQEDDWGKASYMLSDGGWYTQDGTCVGLP